VLARSAALCTLVCAAWTTTSSPVHGQTPAPPATAAPAAAAPAPAAEGVLVHIATPSEVNLEAPRGADWVPICTSPCDHLVRPGDAFRVSGDDVPTSGVFAIKPAPRVTLTVDPSTKQSRVGGVIFVVAGTAGFVPGGVITAGVASFFIFGALFVCPIAAAFGADYGNCTVGAAGLVTPYYASPYVWVPALAGAGLLTIGVVWLAATSGGHPTNVTTALAMPRPQLPAHAFLPWQRLAMPELALPPPAVVPVLSGTF
jgi:hypothetical protein